MTAARMTPPIHHRDEPSPPASPASRRHPTASRKRARCSRPRGAPCQERTSPQAQDPGTRSSGTPPANEVPSGLAQGSSTPRVRGTMSAEDRTGPDVYRPVEAASSLGSSQPTAGVCLRRLSHTQPRMPQAPAASAGRRGVSSTDAECQVCRPTSSGPHPLHSPSRVCLPPAAAKTRLPDVSMVGYCTSSTTIRPAPTFVFIFMLHHVPAEVRASTSLRLDPSATYQKLWSPPPAYRIILRRLQPSEPTLAASRAPRASTAPQRLWPLPGSQRQVGGALVAASNTRNHPSPPPGPPRAIKAPHRRPSRRFIPKLASSAYRHRIGQHGHRLTPRDH